MRGQHLNSKPCPTFSLERIVSGFSQWSPFGAWQVGHLSFSPCQGGQRPYIAVINNEVGLTVPGFRCCPLSGGWQGGHWERSSPGGSGRGHLRRKIWSECVPSASRPRKTRRSKVFFSNKKGVVKFQTSWRKSDIIVWGIMSEVHMKNIKAKPVWTKHMWETVLEYGVFVCFCCILLRFLVAGITMLLPYVAMLIFNKLNRCFSSANHFNCGVADVFFTPFKEINKQQLYAGRMHAYQMIIQSNI